MSPDPNPNSNPNATLTHTLGHIPNPRPIPTPTPLTKGPMLGKMMASTTKAKKYDMKTIQGMRRAQFWSALFMCFSHLKRGMIKPMMMQVKRERGREREGGGWVGESERQVVSAVGGVAVVVTTCGRINAAVWRRQGFILFSGWNQRWTRPPLLPV